MRLRQGGHQLHVPAFFDVEVANILWKRVRKSLLTSTVAAELAEQLLGAPLVRHHDGPLLKPAFELACQTDRTVYDCLYLALAIELGGKLVTADERLVNSLANGPRGRSVIHLRDVP
jgi:predicted nucleic acid-binding protein